MNIGTICLDCASITRADLATIGRIARIQLNARRCGAVLRLENVSRYILELIDLCGLAEVLGVESERQAE